jgi:hypothetical protein
MKKIETNAPSVEPSVRICRQPHTIESVERVCRERPIAPWLLISSSDKTRSTIGPGGGIAYHNYHNIYARCDRSDREPVRSDREPVALRIEGIISEVPKPFSLTRRTTPFLSETESFKYLRQQKP